MLTYFCKDAHFGLDRRIAAKGEPLLETIGFCEDDAAQLSLLRRYLDACREDGEEFRVVAASEPAAFLEALRCAAPDLVFLDIELGNESGLDLGKKIRELYPAALIVYVTAYGQYALEAFQVRAFHYLVKPIALESFRCVLRESLRLLRSRVPIPEKRFSVQIRGEIVSLPYSSILFFEKTGHRIRVHAGERDIYYYGNMQDLLAKLEGSEFFQCHQGFVVNIHRVRSFRERTLFLDADAQVPVSRTYADAVRDKLIQWLFEEDTP